MSDITLEEKIDHWIKEIEATKTEGAFISRQEFIKAKWNIGNILLSIDIKPLAPLIKEMAKLGKTSTRELWRCLKFRKIVGGTSYEEIASQLPGGKEMSWNKLIKIFFPEKKKTRIKKKSCSHKRLKCARCQIVVNDLSPAPYN